MYSSKQSTGGVVTFKLTDVKMCQACGVSHILILGPELIQAGCSTWENSLYRTDSFEISCQS